MIFRSRKAAASEPSLEQTLDEIVALGAANRERRDPQLERRIRELRHRAGAHLVNLDSQRPAHPDPAAAKLRNGSGIPEVGPGELAPGAVRAGILDGGCLLIRGLIDQGRAALLVEEIDRALEARGAIASGAPGPDGYYEEFAGEERYWGGLLARQWVAEGGLWAADSPRLLFEMLEAFDECGLANVINGYLGERPAISVQKCTMRRVAPELNAGGWHQDGAFMGDVHALNVWVSLSRCGDLAPGLDIVPRRLEEIVPTGTEGALFDWSVAPALAEEVAGDLAIVRPVFEPGDVLLFDEMLLHSTASEASMPNPRYAIESWFFGPSGFPGEYAPLIY